ALEVIEWLEAGVAAIERLARRRPELALPRRPLRAAARAGSRRIGAPHAPRRTDRFCGRRDAEGLELAAALDAQPVAAPGRREHVDRDRVKAGALQGAQHVGLD